MVHVGRGLVGVERQQVIADGDALAELLQLRQRELFPQLRLADHDDLYQLRLLGLEVRQHPDFLERRQAQVLRLVDHEQRQAAGLALGDEELGEPVEQHGLAHAGRVDAEVEHDGVEQLARVEHGVHDPRDGRVAIQPSEERLQHRRLPGADLAGDDDEAGMAFDAVAQVAERFLVHLARVQIFRVGAQREGALTKLKVSFVHGRPLRQTSPRRVAFRSGGAPLQRPGGSPPGSQSRSTGSRGCRSRAAAARRRRP